MTTKKEKNLRHCTSYIYYIYHVKKTREIDWSFLCLQQFKQILKMKGEQSPETETLKVENIREITTNKPEYEK